MKTLLLFLFITISAVHTFAEPGYAGEWKKTRLYGHTYAPGGFTEEQYDWIKDNHEIFCFEKTHLRSVYGNPSHEESSKDDAAYLKTLNPRIKPITIYSIIRAYSDWNESTAEAIENHPEWAIANEDSSKLEWDLNNGDRNDWYVETMNDLVNSSELEGIFIDGVEAVYSQYGDSAKSIMSRMDGLSLMNGFNPKNATTWKTGPDFLEHSAGVFVDSWFRRELDTKEGAVTMLDACIDIPEEKVLILFSGNNNDGIWGTDHTFTHAAYLIVANENTYYRWTGDGLWEPGSMMEYHEDFDKKMGAPLAKATKNGYVYTREFRYCSVTVDVENVTSSIVWNQDNGVAVTGVSLSSPSNSLSVGSSIQLSASVTPTNATDQGISWWSVDDTTIATIDQNGLLTAKTIGDVTVTAESAEEGFTSVTTISVETGTEIGPWNLEELYPVPEYETTDVVTSSDVTSLLYQSIDYLGDTVKVFAYYSAPDGDIPAGGWPAVVYVHGGGGTANASWVRSLNDRGYAAISMDLEGHIPSKDGDGNYYATPNPGPSRNGNWGDWELDIEEQWYYHAVAQVMIAHSLIASFDEVNSDKTGIIGVSWGGLLTSTTMGVDSRFKFAIPVYGAGYVTECDSYLGISNVDKEEFVRTNYDGRTYFENVTYPTFWINGTNDVHFPMTMTNQSADDMQEPAKIRYEVEMSHGENTPRSLEEVYAFADNVLQDGDALTSFGTPTITDETVSVSYNTGYSITSAQLCYTLDDGTWYDRSWETITATVSGSTITATIPTGATAVYFNATDSRGLMTTTKYIDPNAIVTTSDNLALLGVATQSSTAYSGAAALAIDGDTNGVYADGSVTHTEVEDEAWWQVDLGEDYSIGEINIFGRSDAAYADRLSDFTLFVINSSGETTYSENFTTYPNVSTDAGSVDGQIIKIVLNVNNPLSLAEVEVFLGEDIPEVEVPDIDTTVVDTPIVEIPDIDTSVVDTSVADTTTATKEDITMNNSNEQLKVYPNPVTNRFVIELLQHEITQYTIFNSSGKIVTSGKTEGLRTTVDATPLLSGVYLVSVNGKTKIVYKVEK